MHLIAEKKISGVPAIIRQLLKDADFPVAPKLWVSRIGGSEQVVIGWTEGDRPFDFILPGYEHLGLRPDAEIIPFRLVARVLNRKVTGSLRRLEQIRQDCPGTLVHLESPPPISDTSYAQEHLDVWFERSGQPLKVAPATLRWKLWKLQTRLTRALCDSFDIPYLASPPVILAHDGYLAQRFWSKDATHGNTAYGTVINEFIAEYAANMVGGTHDKITFLYRSAGL